LDGVNQLNALRGQTAARQEIFVGIGIDLNGNSYGPAMRHGRWKLIENGGGPSTIPENTSEYYLFDLSVDRQEIYNLADEKPVLLDLMKHKLKWYKKQLVPIPQEDPNCPFDGLVNTSIGLTWMPWCHNDKAKDLVVYW